MGNGLFAPFGDGRGVDRVPRVREYAHPGLFKCDPFGIVNTDSFFVLVPAMPGWDYEHEHEHENMGHGWTMAIADGDVRGPRITAARGGGAGRCR